MQVFSNNFDTLIDIDMSTEWFEFINTDRLQEDDLVIYQRWLSRPKEDIVCRVVKYDPEPYIVNDKEGWQIKLSHFTFSGTNVGLIGYVRGKILGRLTKVLPHNA